MMQTQLLDVARGAYSRLSPNTRARLGRFVGLVPERFKWGPTYRQWRDLIAATRANPARVRDYQDRARLAMLSAALRSRYYGELFDTVFGPEVDPKQLLQDRHWATIPVLTSAEVAVGAVDMCTRPIEALDVGSTGGTSGKPVKFYLDKRRSPIEYAFVHDAWSRAGYRAGDARCVFRGVELASSAEGNMHCDHGLAELRCSVFHMTDETMRGYCDEIRARRIRFIHGYPSAIAIFASFLVRSGAAPLSQIEGVFPTSERFYPDQRALLAQAFDRATIVPFYGLSEKTAFACARRDDPDAFGFDPLYGYTELLDADGTPVTSVGASGRIISTGLIFEGMPFIRYDTGDTGELVELPNAGNGYRLTVRGITPKHGTEYFVGRSGALIAIKGIISNLQGTAYGIREYQFYQDTPGKAVVRIVPASPGAADFARYRDLLDRKAAGELTTSVEVVERIPVSPRGKRRLIDQRLDVAGAADRRLLPTEAG
jgi:phenylacetate-coenzyme A ligase PaaK-like adenylate-forming protein